MTYALITGGSSGIGEAIAYKLAEKKYNLIIVARNKEKLQNVQEKIKQAYPDIDVRCIIQDVGDIDSLPKFYEETKDYDIKIWINNAGYSIDGPMLDYDIKDFVNMTNINGLGAVILSKLFVDDYKNTDGAVLVNVSSTAGYSLVESLPYYSDVKFLLSAFSESLANELKKNNKKLKVKILAPGPVDTPFVQTSKGEHVTADDIWDRYYTVDEIAECFMHLLYSDSVVGKVNTDTYEFELLPPQLPNRWSK